MSILNQIISGAYLSLARTVRTATPTILTLRRYLFYLGGVYASGILFQHHFYTWSHSQGPSMYPTIPAEGSIAVIRKLSKKQIANSTLGSGTAVEDRQLGVGDIIQFQAPIFANQMAGKRIIGMPGDYVVKDPHCAPSVGGSLVPGITDWRAGSSSNSARAATDSHEREIDREEPEMIRVPEGHVWVAGDNMSWSRDSRFYGPVPMALISGRQVGHLEGLFTAQSYAGAMRRVPKDEEDWVLNGRAARIVDLEVESR